MSISCGICSMNRAPERRRQIVVVEDETALRSMLVEELEEVGYQVIEAEMAEEALALLFTDERVDALLTGTRLAGAINGWRLAREFRSWYPRLPVVYTTGYTHEAASPDPGSIVLHKPFRLTEAIEALATAGVN